MKFYLLAPFILTAYLSACRTADHSLSSEVKQLPTMTIEEYEASVIISEQKAKNQALKSLMTISKVKNQNPALNGATEIKAGTEIIHVDDLPTETEVLEGDDTLPNVGGGIINQAKASLSAYFMDPQNKAVVTGATVGALTALAFNRFSERSGNYYRALVVALNHWTDMSIRASFGNQKSPGSLRKAANSTSSTQVVYKYSKKFYGSLEKSLGVTGFKPAALAITGSAISSSLAAFWSYGDYTEEIIEDIETPEDFDKRLGPQIDRYKNRDAIAEIANRYAYLLTWDESQKSMFYKAAVSEIIATIPAVASRNGGKITAETIIPFDALTVIERVNQRELERSPHGILTTQAHIDHLRSLVHLAQNIEDDDSYNDLTIKDQNIMRLIDNLDTLVAANFIMSQMSRDPDITPHEKEALIKLIGENKNLLQWVSRNFD